MRRAPLALLALALSLAVSRVDAMSRSTNTIVRAIHHANPHVSDSNARAWATVIRREAITRHFDPFTLVAIVRFESGFNPSRVNNNPPREYSVGLSQINALAMFRSCRVPPLLSSASCQSAIGGLLNGSHNLRVASTLISVSRDYCRRRTGHPALFARWLSSFQGYDSRAGVVCNMRKDRRGRWHDLPVPSKTRRVIQYRRELVRAIR